MLQDPINSVILFAILCASAGVGFFIHPRLPERHRSPQSITLVQLAITLLVTFTAIVLGLLTTSVKAGFDSAYSARGDYAGKLVQPLFIAYRTANDGTQVVSPFATSMS